jgi:hypothetical protein
MTGEDAPSSQCNLLRKVQARTCCWVLRILRIWHWRCRGDAAGDRHILLRIIRAWRGNLQDRREESTPLL